MQPTTITGIHLQYTLALMAHPAPYRQIFFENTDTLPPLFLLLDRKATYAEAIRTKNGEIGSSYFGESVLKFANIDFAIGEGTLAPQITQEFDPTAQEALRHFSTHLFLNLAWWYVGPMLWAARFKLPYMPESWVKEFLRQKVSVSFGEQMAYLDGIVDFIRSQNASVRLLGQEQNIQEIRWISPYEDLSGQLGDKGRYALRVLIGMFKEALENPVGPATPSSSAAGHTPDLGSPVKDFLESLDLGGIGENNEPEEN